MIELIDYVIVLIGKVFLLICVIAVTIMAIITFKSIIKAMIDGEK